MTYEPKDRIMTSLVRLAIGSIAAMLVSSCDTTVVDPAANLADDVVIDVDQQAIPQSEPSRDSAQGQVPRSPVEEPIMPQPDPMTTPPPATPPALPPAKPPRRVILPSPIQPPAEVDPVQPYPGDEVPR